MEIIFRDMYPEELNNEITRLQKSLSEQRAEADDQLKAVRASKAEIEKLNGFLSSHSEVTRKDMVELGLISLDDNGIDRKDLMTILSKKIAAKKGDFNRALLSYQGSRDVLMRSEKSIRTYQDLLHPKNDEPKNAVVTGTTNLTRLVVQTEPVHGGPDSLLSLLDFTEFTNMINDLKLQTQVKKTEEPTEFKLMTVQTNIAEAKTPSVVANTNKLSVLQIDLDPYHLEKILPVDESRSSDSNDARTIVEGLRVIAY